MKMHGRKLTHKISIEIKSHNRDSIGGESDDVWTEFIPAWAEVKPIRGAEFMSANSNQNSVSHRVNIRFRDGVLPEMRVKHKNRYLKIVAVRDFFEREKWLELMCEEIL